MIWGFLSELSLSFHAWLTWQVRQPITSWREIQEPKEDGSIESTGALSGLPTGMTRSRGDEIYELGILSDTSEDELEER